jgi:integrase
LLVARGFARYLAGLDPRTQIPPIGLIAARRQRRAPYIYTDQEIRALMAQARTGIRQTVVAATYETLIGLLAVTGMRTGEAIHLDRGDIDWRQGVLLVRESKFNKSRYIPIDPTAVQALDRYSQLRDRLCRAPRELSFLVSLRHGRLSDSAVHATFRRLCRNAGVGTDAPFAPRLHEYADLRHTLAVRTLLGWYRQGDDVHAARLPVLSTFLGHRNPADTYYYLSAAPELLAHAAGMLNARREVAS